MTGTRKTLALVAGTALACGLAPTAATAAPAPTHTTTAPASAQAISCETEMGSDPFYPGESASEIYDERYSQGAEIPHLDDDFTPQGLGHWADWDGSGTNLLLVTAYQDGADARIHGIEADSGEHVGSVAIAGAHVGGLAVVDDWAFVSGRGSDRIRKYDLDELGDALQAGGTPYLTQVGEAQEVPAASFLGTDGTTLYSGKFNDVDRDVMHAFSVAADGTLTQGTEYEVPMKTQGMTVADGTFIYSTSYGRTNRSNIYTVDEGATEIDPTARCYRAPSMTQGITDHNGRLYVLNESGAAKFADPPPRNDVRHVHEADVADAIDF